MGPIEILVPLAAFAMLAMMVHLVARLFAFISLNRTIREALRSHAESVPLLAERLEQRQPWADALLGWILIALGVGIGLLAVLFESGERRLDQLQAAFVPTFVGIVVLIFIALSRRSRS